MKLAKSKRYGSQKAFTLVEVAIASGLAGIMFLAGMSGFSSGFSGVKLDREESRATQILLEKTEMLRLYNWDEITGNDPTTYVPTNFTAPFFPRTNNSNGGFTYTGTVSMVTAPMASSYSNDIKLATIKLSWRSGNVMRARSMITYVSRYGLQNYIY